LRTPAYEELINIVNGNAVTFGRYKFNKEKTRNAFENYAFTNQRNATRSMLTWYAFSFEKQPLLSLDKKLQIEHIYAKKRQQLEHGLLKEGNLELLGNKVLLESSINIAAAGYRFEDKKKIYSGEMRRGKNKEASQIVEVNEIAAREQFGEAEIIQRNQTILDTYFAFLESEQLLTD